MEFVPSGTILQSSLNNRLWCQVFNELSPCFRRYAAKKVRDTMRTLIFLRAPRRNKVFPNHSQSSRDRQSQSHIYSRDFPSQSQSQSRRGLQDQDQPQHFRAGGERPAHQASYQLLKIIKLKIISLYHNCQARSQFLEVDVLHRQKEEQGGEPPVISAINVSYI